MKVDEMNISTQFPNKTLIFGYVMVERLCIAITLYCK